MKTTIISLSIFLSSIGAMAQFSYQAVIRDSEGSPQTNVLADFEIAILHSGDTIYTENHPNVDSGELGIVNLAIGTGENANMPFDEIDWSQGDFSISVSVDGDPLPASPIHSVPVAEYAKNTLWNQNEDESINYASGNVGINTINPQTSLHISGSIKVEDEISHEKIGLYTNSETKDNWIISYDENGEEMWSMILGDRSNDNMFYLDGIYGDNIIDFQIREGITKVAKKFQVLGTNSHEKIELFADTSTQDNSLISYDENESPLWTMWLGDRTRDDSFVLDGTFGDGQIDFEIRQGKTAVRCLEINGGCDIKEDFNSTESLQPGDVVILDEHNPGEIKKSTIPYDRKVAGVISGANGINPGLTLSQDGITSGEYPLAMVGQVYVKATGKVKVGDMLTTSSKPGLAMAVTNYSICQGAVIGKAMSAQDDGEGFVLVLVNLQ